MKNVSLPSEPIDFSDSYNKTINDLNQIINNHNDKAKNHKNEVSTAREKIELHLIATALEGQNYNEIVEDTEDKSKKEKEALDIMNKNNTEISELEKINSNIGDAITKINDRIKEFFGREEIQLELDDNKKGYKIKRYGKPAKNLSEGEKTAIAFSYFIVKVGEADFDKSRSIIFIDDPISSFDSNFIYYCFSLIKNNFNNVSQLFISTHNFQLFNLIKDWFIKKNIRNNNKSKKKNKLKKTQPCEFFMIENYNDSETRKAKLVKLDKTLLDYKSEYQFLFTKLKKFSQEQDIDHEDYYTIGNMARRFFDIFADFKIPTYDNQKTKMNSLVREINIKKEEISSIDSEMAYKLINEFSHNYDPTSAVEHKDKEESKKAIKILLKIVEKSDSKHYEKLDKISQQQI